MIVADELKKKNRAEYLLYMWQVEDLIRAYGCDAERIEKEYISRFNVEENKKQLTKQWYNDLCNMMISEGKKNFGHLQICQNILQELNELHLKLLHSRKFPYYREMYYKVLPYIVEIRAKNKTLKGLNSENELELQTCFDLLYGVMILRLQKKTISTGTNKAVKDISTFLGQLSDYYFQDKANPIEFD